MLLKKNVCRQVDRVVGAIGSFSVDNWVILVAVSAVGIVGYLCYTASLKSVTPTSVSVLRSQEIVLAYFCQVLGSVTKELTLRNVPTGRYVSQGLVRFAGRVQEGKRTHCPCWKSAAHVSPIKMTGRVCSICWWVPKCG